MKDMDRIAELEGELAEIKKGWPEFVKNQVKAVEEIFAINQKLEAKLERALEALLVICNRSNCIEYSNSYGQIYPLESVRPNIFEIAREALTELSK